MLRFALVDRGAPVPSIETMRAEEAAKPKARRARIVIAYDGDAIAIRDTKVGDEQRLSLDALAYEADILFPVGGHERQVPDPEPRVQEAGGTMQYGVVEMSVGSVLMDALEIAVLEACKPVEDEPADEAAFRWHVAYGVFWAQPWRDSDEAVAELLANQGAGFGRITSEGTCRLSEVRAIELQGMMRVGASVQFPCAALVGTIEEIPPADRFALSLFPRLNGQMTPLTSLLYRPGILALKGEEKRAMRLLNPDPNAGDWRSFIRPERVSKLARMEVEGHA